MSVDDNLPRWDGQRRGFYEVWYLTWTDPATGDGCWLRYVIEAPLAGVGEPYAQLWFARLCARDPARSFAINRRFPIASLALGRAPFEVRIGPARLVHDGARGSLSGDGHAVEWDLTWAPGDRTLRQLPAIMYERGLGETTVLSPSVDTRITGSLTIDGERFALTAAPAGQTHLWGTKHAAAWAWAHCNAFDDRPGVALELLHVRLRRRGLAVPPMTIAVLRLPDQELALNRFDQGLLSGPATDLATGRVRFRAGGLLTRVEGELSCTPADLVRAHYHDPDGEERYCHFTALGDLRLTVSRRVRGRWQVTDRLTAARRAAFEIGRATPDPAVTREHVDVT